LLGILSDEDFVVETDLTDEEREIVAKGYEEFKKDPSAFIDFDDYLANKTR
jgi:hypothetical protein